MAWDASESPSADIAYIEAMKDNCIIHMVDGKRYTQSCPMGDIEPELNPDMFKRIHRSFIVNISYIDMYYYGHVVLENGMEVHIGDKTWKKEDELKGLKAELAALDRKIQLRTCTTDRERMQRRGKEYGQCRGCR